MSPYANELASARLNALRTLVDALNEADTPEEKRRCAVAIFNAPDPSELDDEIELVNEDAQDQEDDGADERDDTDDTDDFEAEDDSRDTDTTDDSEPDSDPRDDLDPQAPARTSDIAHRPSDIPTSYTPS